MAQYFKNKNFSSSFDENTIPKLLFVCKAGGNDTKMPRAMHMHDNQAEIVFIKDGNGLHTVDGKQYETRKGDILLYNSGVIHDECTNHGENMTAYSCGITELKIKGLPLNHFISNNIQAVIPAGEYFNEIENLFEMLCTYTLDSSNKAAEISNYLLRALLSIILILIEKGSRSLEQDKKAMSMRIKNYIDVHCLEFINLYTISRDLNMSQYYLSHIFKESFGYSPIQYVIRRRIGEAQSLLINTEHSIAEITYIVGFNNVNYFYAVFLKMVGMSPGRYRKYWVEEHT